MKRAADAVSSYDHFHSSAANPGHDLNGSQRKKPRKDTLESPIALTTPHAFPPPPVSVMADDMDDEDDDDDDGPSDPAGGPGSGDMQGANGGPSKPKATRGSRACTVCRRLKMKCVGAENGPPCKRCIAGKHECIFEESNRGKRTNKKNEMLTKGMEKIQAQLASVMRVLGDPKVAKAVAAQGGIPGFIAPSGENIDPNHGQGAGSPDESGRSPSNDEPMQLLQHQSGPTVQFYAPPPNSMGHHPSFPSPISSRPPSFNAGHPGNNSDDMFYSASQMQLTRQTENLTYHSPDPSPRPGNAITGEISSASPHRASSYGSSSHAAAAAAAIHETISSVNAAHSQRRSLSHSHSHHQGQGHSGPSARGAGGSGSGRAGSMTPSISQLPPSPHLPTLPDNSLNPLGLLAEASLANRRAHTKRSAQEMADRLVEQALHGDIDENGEPQHASGSVVGTPSVHSGPGGSSLPGGEQGDEDVKDGVSVRTPGSGSAAKSVATAERKVGVANETYFRPGPMNILPLRRLFIERQVQPEMLSFVSTQEVLALFDIYFKSMNMHCSLLVRDFHTPSLVCSRSPFLLTVICAIASKFYPDRPDLHPRLNRIVKKLSFNVPERGFKSLEIVQAYLLLSLWGCGPVERFEQDKTWLLLGLAIRMGTDLNLHRKGTGLSVEGSSRAEWRARERELRNRERTWVLCYVLDRSLSAQMGKPHSITEDYIIRNTSTWFRLPEARNPDVGLAAYAELQRIISRSLDFLYSNTSSSSGLHTDLDYLLVIKTIEQQLYGWQETWDLANLSRIEDPGAPSTAEQVTYVTLMKRFYFNYSMLVVNSFGLQNALERSRLDVGHFFGRCYSSAMACALIVRDELGPTGFLRYSPDSHFVLSSYAVLTLLKLIRPEFQTYMESEQRTLALVNDVADTLEKVAVNSSHTPALYSTFLRAVVTARTHGPSQPSSPGRSGDNEMEGLTGQQAGGSRPNQQSHNSPIDQQLASNPAAGVFGDEQQFGDGALGLKMFPPNGSVVLGPMNGTTPGVPGVVVNGPNGNMPPPPGLGPGTVTPGGDLIWNPPGAGQAPAVNGVAPGPGARGQGELDLQAAMSFQLPHPPQGGDDFSSLSMDNILSGGFWDNVLIPGYSNSGLEGLSGGFVYGSSGSGFITPRRSSPEPEQANNGGFTMPGIPNGLVKP